MGTHRWLHEPDLVIEVDGPLPHFYVATVADDATRASGRVKAGAPCQRCGETWFHPIHLPPYTGP